MKSKMTESSSYWSPGSDSVLSNEESSTRTFHRTTSAQVNFKLISKRERERGRKKRINERKEKEEEKERWRRKKRESEKSERERERERVKEERNERGRKMRFAHD